MNGIIGEQIVSTITILCISKISVPPWAAPCPARQARGTAWARPVKVLKSEGTPGHAQGPLSIGTGTPNHMTGVPGRASAWACQAHGTDMARPGQSLSLLHQPRAFKYKNSGTEDRSTDKINMYDIYTTSEK